jgi:hypothetical protein
MAEKPILITPEGKKIMTLSGAKAYYESKRKPKKKALGPLKNYKGKSIEKKSLKNKNTRKRKPLAGTGFIRGSKKGKPKSK